MGKRYFLTQIGDMRSPVKRSDIPSLDDLRAFETAARLGSLRSTVESLRSAEVEQPAVVLSCEPSVAMRWLIPRLANLQEAHPEIALHLSVGGGPVEFRRDRIDLAFRRLDFALPESWRIERLFAETVGPVLSAQLLAAFQEGRYT